MKNKQHTLPSFFLISSAVDGNENAIEKLLLFYEAYISKCCLRPFYDEYGNVYIKQSDTFVLAVGHQRLYAVTFPIGR